VAFLDADDSWLPTKIEKQVAVFRMHPQVGVVTTRCQRVDAEGRPLPTRSKRSSFRSWDQALDLQHELLMRGNVLVASSAVVRKDLLEEVGGFSEEGRMLSEDYDLWLRVAGRTRFFVLSERLTNYRVLRHSLLHGSLEKEYGTQLEILRRHQDRYAPWARRKRLAKIYCDWADSAFWVSDPDGWRRWRQSLAHNPIAGSTWLLGARAALRLVLVRLGLVKAERNGVS
jgi:hypothetical protein